MKQELLAIKNLHAAVDDKAILKGLNLTVKRGEVHILMGPNGAGKSTLANVLMGNPRYNATAGEIILDGESVEGLKTDERAKRGLFLSFQYPEEVPGITVENFLRSAKGAVSGKPQKLIPFRRLLHEKMDMLEMKREYASRYLNVGFSGGEKKKNEILQMAVLEPKLAILDETDSGLDIDAIRVVSQGVSRLINENNAILIITHYNKLLEYFTPDAVHVLYDGRIVESGDLSLARRIEEKGYEPFKAKSAENLAELAASGKGAR